MKKRYTSLLPLFLLVVLADFALAQDPHLAQFYAAPTFYNPAMAGVHVGKSRFVVNYREQWNSVMATTPFRTFAASFDLRQRVGRSDYFAWGMQASADFAGRSNYTRQSGALMASFLKQLAGGRYTRTSQYLVAGVQVGAGQHSINFDNLWFSSQFDLSEERVDFNAPSGEMLLNATRPYLNFNAGLLWWAIFDDNFSLYLGGAMHHLNAPSISFVDNAEPYEIPVRWLGQIGGELPLSREMSLLPGVLVMGQGPSMIAMFGSAIRYTNRDWNEVALRFGMWGNVVNDYIAPKAFSNLTVSTILEMTQWQIGISYDVNMARLAAPTNNRGALELSFIYIQPAKRREKVNCPRF